MYKNKITLQPSTLLSTPNSSMTGSFLLHTNALMTDSLLSPSTSSMVVESTNPGECYHHQVTGGKTNILKNKRSKWRSGTFAIPNVTTRKRSARRKWIANSGASKLKPINNDEASSSINAQINSLDYKNYIESLHKKAYEELNRQINVYSDQFVHKMRCFESMPIEQQSKWLRNSALPSESKKNDEIDQDIEGLIVRMSGDSMEVADYSAVYKYQLECGNNFSSASDDSMDMGYGDLW
ncbi:1905_t:CDS:2 [Ambispora gerdemannii]|uniref:1905_t:CDS:1 n=1 Tax=Ambispora gerdemannii TaxID=144530 RepID=A0A9N8YNI5_9GLOM|nr:1905_t:CDS:2 [Ambispora gerdemannii]